MHLKSTADFSQSALEANTKYLFVKGDNGILTDDPKYSFA